MSAREELLALAKRARDEALELELGAHHASENAEAYEEVACWSEEDARRFLTELAKALKEAALKDTN